MFFSMALLTLPLAAAQAPDAALPPEPPPEAAAPCPGPDMSDMESFLRNLIKNSAESYEATEKAMCDYAYYEDVAEFDHLKDNSFAPKNASTSWNYFSKEFEAFRRVPLKKDGEEVPLRERESAAAREEKHLRKEKRLQEKRKAAEEKKNGEEGGEENPSIQIGWTKMTVEEIARFFEFVYEGCDAIEGAPAYVLRYRPRGDFSGDKEFIRKALPPVQGRLWVAQEGHFVLRFQMEFAGQYKPMGRLNVSELDLDVVFTQVDGRHWFPSRMDFGLDARFWKIMREHLHAQVRRRDFRRFVVETEGGQKTAAAAPPEETAAVPASQ